VNTPLVTASGLTRHFAGRGLLNRGRPVQAVNDVTLSIARGESVLSAPPGFRDWLIEPVLGGTAYAGISTGIIHMIDPSSGETCGSLSVPGFFSLGGDGSLLHVDSQGRDRTTGVCTVTVYPNVLRTTSSAGPPSQAGRISNSTKPMEVTR